MQAFTDEGLARIDELVTAAVDAGQAPGVVAAVARGDDVHVSTAGRLSVDGAAMRRDTIFRIASITKPMTAAAVLSLVADGALRLDEPIDRLLPELADRQVLRRPDGPLTETVPAERAPTVRELLNFTWGFGMQGAMFTAAQPWPIFTATIERDLFTFGPPQPGRLPDPGTWIARLGELPLVVQPGTKWLYQTGSQVLGVLAARAAGKPFAEVLRERVFAPLGMIDTGFHATDVTRLATAYHRVDGALAVDDPPDGQWSRSPAFADGSGGLVSTVEDLVRFGRMLARGGDPVLTPDTVTQMTANQLTDAQRRDEWDGFDFLGDAAGWGYGLAVHTDGRYTWDGGFGTAWSNVPDLDLTTVVLTQRAVDETGPPAVCADVLAVAKEAAT